MRFDWLDWSNPVALWWSFLVTVSAVNITLLFCLRALYRANHFGAANAIFAAEPLALLSAVYVFGCAFRAMDPCRDGRRRRRLCGFHVHDRRADVYAAVARSADGRSANSRIFRRLARSGKPLGGHAQHRAMAGRDSLDVALFQRRGLDQ